MKKLIQNPIIKIVFGLAFCYLPLLLSSLLIFKPLAAHFSLSDELSRMLRFVINSIIILLTYYLFIKWTEEKSIFDWRMRFLFRDSGIGVLLAIGSISIVILILAITGVYQVQNVSFSWPSLFYLLIVFAFMSIMEEILFRGIIYRITEKLLGTSLALVLSVLIFGFPHLFNQDANWISMLAASIGGVLLGLMFTLSRQLWMPIAFHWFWNFSQVYYGSNLSGSAEYAEKVLIKSSLIGPTWLTGGIAGIENSMITIGLTIVGSIVLILIGIKKKRFIAPFWVKK